MKVALALVVAVGLGVSLGESAETKQRRAGLPYYGRIGVASPERTDAGVWDGTWIYINRDGRIAIWIRRDKGGKPELKLQYQSLNVPEAFETDWSGKATYYLSGQPASFEIRLDQRDDSTITGTWKWDVQFPDSGRSETGTFTFYRAGDGRKLVMRFDQWERVLRRRDQVRRQSSEVSWTFLKASKRLALWDELPF